MFDRHLIDADFAVNHANWQWLSASRFFYQYFRVYSPETFYTKYDKEGKYIRKYCPELKDMPAKYIHMPWKAPLADQKAAGCVLGKDYPERMVIHDEARNENLARMKEAYADQAGVIKMMNNLMKQDKEEIKREKEEKKNMEKEKKEKELLKNMMVG